MSDPYPQVPPQSACHNGVTKDEARITEMRWREAMTMAKEQQSSFQEWTERAECAKNEWNEKQNQQKEALQLQHKREKQWETAMKTATNDLEAIRSEYQKISQKVEKVAKRLQAGEKCVQLLNECNPKEKGEASVSPQEPPKGMSYPKLSKMAF